MTTQKRTAKVSLPFAGYLKQTNALLLLLTAFVFGPACSCGDNSTLRDLDAFIFVERDATGEEACAFNSDEPEALLLDCGLTMDASTIAGVNIRLNVLNLGGSTPLTVDNVFFENSGGWEVISTPELGTGIEPYSEEERDDQIGEIVIRYVSTFEAPRTGYLHIISNADNVESNANGERELIIPLVISDDRAPIIQVEPAACDFGLVGLGAPARCDLSISNQGNAPLILGQLAFENPSDPTFVSATAVSVGTTIDPGTAPLTLTIVASPESMTRYENALLIPSNDPVPARSTIRVPLTVEGSEAPTAIPTLKSINGILTGSDADLAPLDVVIVTGEESLPSRPELSIVEYRWELVDVPEGSSVQLSAPNAMETGFTYTTSGGLLGGGTAAGIDLAGSYTLRLSVRDSNNLWSTNEGLLTISSSPSDALHVEMLWNTDGTDFDLRLQRGAGGGDFCDSQTCYYANCIGGLDIDGISGISDGDPSLDIDNISGFGPENINVKQPSGSDIYYVGAHYFGASGFGGSGNTTVRIKIYIDGSLRFDDERIMSDSNQLWNAARIDWNNGNVFVDSLNEITYLNNSCRML